MPQVYPGPPAKPAKAWQATTGFRRISDARLALNLRHHGVTHFAVANEKHFESFGFERVWSLLD